MVNSKDHRNLQQQLNEFCHAAIIRFGKEPVALALINELANISVSSEEYWASQLGELYQLRVSEFQKKFGKGGKPIQ